MISNGGTARLCGSSLIERLREECRLVDEWAARNPELSKAWDEAREEDDRRKRKIEQEAYERHQLKTAGPKLHRMGVPQRTVGDVEAVISGDAAETLALKAAREFVASKRSLAVLFGGTGSGKTVAASWCLLRARREGAIDERRGLFIRGSAIARIPRFDDNGLWDRLLTVRWLVIDDLGAQKGGDYLEERLNELIDARYAECLRTVITCNVKAADFREAMGDRITSRIRGDGMVVGCGDEDLRVRRQP